MIRVTIFSILSAVVLMGCNKEEVRPCNCGLISKVYIRHCQDTSWIEVMNECSANKHVFYISTLEAQGLMIADEYCPQETRW